VLEPEQSPDQPTKRDPAEGDAVNVTRAPDAYESEHVAPQLRAPESALTVPEPVPDLVTARV
jgi:hypothetical protein